MEYINVGFDPDEPTAMATVQEAWEQSTHACKETKPHILDQWKKGDCRLRIDKSVWDKLW